MSSYTVKFNPNDNRTKREQALDEIKSYLGPKMWKKVEDLFPPTRVHNEDGTINFTAAKSWLRAINFAMVMVGVRGYAVYAYKMRFLERSKEVPARKSKG